MKIKIGKLEIAFAAILLVRTIADWTHLGEKAFLQITGFVCFVLGCIIAAKYIRRATRHILWRLRNRLAVAYFFVAVVPIVLICLLVALGTALVGGQLSIYLITQELERRTTSLHELGEFMMSDTSRVQQRAEEIAEYARSRYPGLELVITGNRPFKHPGASTITPPPEGHGDNSGMILKDGMLYGWAHVVDDTRSFTALFPVSREFLGQLTPGIGETGFITQDSGKAVLHRTVLPKGEASVNRLPPALNRFDFEIPWGAPITLSLWEKPDETKVEFLTVRTRPSAVFRAISGQKMEIRNELVSILFISVAILFLIAELIALVIGVSVTKSITGAVHALYEGTRKITKGDFSHRIRVPSAGQLGDLAVSFNHMTENVQRLLAVEKEQERIQSELAIAHEVQSQLYPRKLPETKCVRLTACCNPARTVSGDYYDYQEIGAGKLAIAIGDVAGKGISAALLMATVQSSFRAQLRGSLELAAAPGSPSAHVSVSTSSVVSHLNQQLHADTTPEKYATFFLGVFDETSNAMTYTNAGHLPPMLVREGKAEMLEVNGMVVGAFPFAKYGESRVQLVKDDLLVLYTDGITEPENAYGEMFGEDRMAELVLRNAHLDEATILERLVGAVQQWTGSEELQDDMTLLFVRRC